MANDKVSIHGAGAGRWVLMPAATGSVVCLGDVWRHPYMVGMLVALLILSVCSVAPGWSLDYIPSLEGGQDFVNSIDDLSPRILLPLGGLTFVLFAGWLLKRETVRDERAMKSSQLFSVVYWLLRVVAPIGVLIVFVAGLSK